MEDFNQLFHQAVAIKQSTLHQQRKEFEKLPTFLKAGLYYLGKYDTVRI